jgi:hypothetical protein
MFIGKSFNQNVKIRVHTQMARSLHSLHKFFIRIFMYNIVQCIIFINIVYLFKFCQHLVKL